MKFPDRDVFWCETADFVLERAGPSDAILAPDIFAARFPKIYRYIDVIFLPQLSYDWVILHKGLVEELPYAFVARSFEDSKPVFANEVFVVLSRLALAALASDNPHLLALTRRLKDLPAAAPPVASSAAERALPQPGATWEFSTPRALVNFVGDAIKSNLCLSAKFEPCFEDKEIWVIPNVPSKSDNTVFDDFGFPIPPDKKLRPGGGPDEAGYLLWGREHVSNMRKILEASDFYFEDGNRILDFGCAGGRLIRHLKDLSEKCEIWGCDVTEECIIWCQEHLSPPFNFFTCTSFPHLPFADDYFNVIYAGSVFTHIAVLADTWLLELKRILRPGGRMYITVHDKNTIRISGDKKRRGETPKFGEDITRYENSDFGMLVRSSLGYQKGFDAQVFYDIDFIRQKWGRMLNIISITPEAYADQTAILLSK
jgi:SAM-dependent methyltransferase